MNGYEPHTVAQLWLGHALEPNVWVDITGTIEIKREALRAHPSQFGEEIVGFVDEMSRGNAMGQDFEYAESFRIWFDREGPPTASAK